MPISDTSLAIIKMNNKFQRDINKIITTISTHIYINDAFESKLGLQN